MSEFEFHMKDLHWNYDCYVRYCDPILSSKELLFRFIRIDGFHCNLNREFLEFRS